MGKTPETQLGFVLGPENSWTAPQPVGEPPELESYLPSAPKSSNLVYPEFYRRVYVSAQNLE